MLTLPLVGDLSFVVMNKQIPIAVCPLLVEDVNGVRQGSCCGGGFLPLPLCHPRLGAKQRRALEAYVFAEATKRLLFENAKRWLIESEISSIGTDAADDQFPSRMGALDISVPCHVMDLTQPDDMLWNQLRHSAKSTINQGLKAYQFAVYDQDTFTFEVGERHRLLHHKCAGRITRPISSFHKMYSWVFEGSGLMFEQKYRGEVVQMIFVALGNRTASGASAADDPDFQWKIPMTHSMNYFIFKEVQRRGVWYYDIGETSNRSTLFRRMSPKERSICEFKRGFGKQTLPWKRWIWFSEPAEELAYLTDQLSIYQHHLSPNADAL
jgi:hypothetical protein